MKFLFICLQKRSIKLNFYYWPVLGHVFSFPLFVKNTIFNTFHKKDCNKKNSLRVACDNQQTNMKKLLPLLTGITLSQMTIAQNPYLTDYKYSFRINNLSTFSKRETPVFVPFCNSYPQPRGTRNANQIVLFQPTYSFDWQSKRKNTHEIELIDFVLNRSDSRQYMFDSIRWQYTRTDDRFYETSISLRYEYKINFCTNKESRWVPSIGFSFNPYYQLTHTSGQASAPYQTGVQTWGIRAAFNPSITYFISKRLYVNAGLSLTMADFSRTTYNNPTLLAPIGNRNQFVYYGLKNIKDLIQFKVGIGYRF